jgi:small subunit ribosomal protein S7
MPRKGPAPKRPLPADPVYGSPLVSQLVSKILLDGKKTIAQGIVYTAMEGTRTKTGIDPVQTLKRALDNVKPALEVKSRRVGGATYQVPVQIEGPRRQSLAMRWLLTSARGRPGKSMQEKLANELLDAFNNTGATIKRRDDTHRMAEANRAFSHYGRF